MSAPETISRPLASPSVPRMSRVQFWTCLALSAALFVFSVGPVWNHPWNINLLDSAIYISYGAIPVLVIACLVYNKTLNWRGAFLDMMEMTLLKYGLTFGFALLLWATSHRPLLALDFLKASSRWTSPAALQPSASAPAELPPPSVIAKETTSSLSGKVLGRDGLPASKALVFISKGLEQYHFAPPSTPLSLENQGHGIEPKISAAMLGQPILARSVGGSLHTFVARDIKDIQAAGEGGTPRLNVPLISAGTWTPIRFEGSGFIAAIYCTVHWGKSDEPLAYTGVFAHPFFHITAGDGLFSFSGVPQGPLTVSVFHPEIGLKAKDLQLVAGEPINLTLDLSR